MTILATDDFTRADNADLGANWDIMTLLAASGLTLAGNKAVQTGGITVPSGELYVGTWPNDQYSQAILTTASVVSTSGPGLIVRGTTAAATYYGCALSQSASGNLELFKVVAGAYTQLITPVNRPWNDGDLWRLQMVGTTLSVWRNGKLIVSVTDASIASGRPGLYYGDAVNAAASFDNWEAGEPWATPPTLRADFSEFPPRRRPR